MVAANIDRIAVDGLLTWVPAQVARMGGSILSRMQNGMVYTYTVGFTVGAAALIWWFTYPHTELESEVASANVTWTADRGAGYEYRWDFDTDGEYDTEWSSEPVASHEYGATDSYFGLVAILDVTGMEDSEPIELELDEEAMALPLDDLTPEGVRAGEDGAAPADPTSPTIRLDGAIRMQPK